MPEYESHSFRPPAPVALVSVRSPTSGIVVENVSMLLDTGADISLLPRQAVVELTGDTSTLPQFELQSFDGATSLAAAVQLELSFLRKLFRGQFLLIESEHGVIGRNILNNVSLMLDGPSLSWNEVVH